MTQTDNPDTPQMEDGQQAAEPEKAPPANGRRRRAASAEPAAEQQPAPAPAEGAPAEDARSQEPRPSGGRRAMVPRDDGEAPPAADGASKASGGKGEQGRRDGKGGHGGGGGDGQGGGKERAPRAPHPLDDLGSKDGTELARLAAAHGIDPIERREDLVLALLNAKAEDTGQLIGAGILHIRKDGRGLLVPKGGVKGGRSIIVPTRTISTHKLRAGDLVAGIIASTGNQGGRNGVMQYSLNRVDVVNGKDPSALRHRADFDKFSAVYPNRLIDLETSPTGFAARLINLVAPIGHGQRALIVAPPKAGKTMVLKEIANSIARRDASMVLIAALIGERPEEVTDFRRSTEAEVYGSTFDEAVEEQCKMAEVALNRARRLVEGGADVVILMDSLTRLARAYNVAAPSSGKTLSGGMDPIALYPPKKFFGAARNCEEGGSLTIIATALVETGSRLDELIYEEFKGTGNMELHLDRPMAEKRIFPAIDVVRSGTRHEELLLEEGALRRINLLRRWAAQVRRDAGGNAENPSESIVARLRKSETNAEFLESLAKRA